MKWLFIMVAAVAPLALAQTNVMGAAGMPALMGAYKGILMGAYAPHSFDVEITGQQGATLVGKATFWGGLAACRGTMPLTGEIRESVITLNVVGRTPDCARVLTVTPSGDSKLAGTMPAQQAGRTEPWQIELHRK